MYSHPCNFLQLTAYDKYEHRRVMQEQVTAADLGDFLMEYAQSDVLVRLSCTRAARPCHQPRIVCLPKTKAGEAYLCYKHPTRAGGESCFHSGPMYTVQGMIANSHLAQADANPKVLYLAALLLCQLVTESLAGINHTSPSDGPRAACQMSMKVPAPSPCTHHTAQG